MIPLSPLKLHIFSCQLITKKLPEELRIFQNRKIYMSKKKTSTIFGEKLQPMYISTAFLSTFTREKRKIYIVNNNF